MLYLFLCLRLRLKGQSLYSLTLTTRTATVIMWFDSLWRMLSEILPSKDSEEPFWSRPRTITDYIKYQRKCNNLNVESRLVLSQILHTSDISSSACYTGSLNQLRNYEFGTRYRQNQKYVKIRHRYLLCASKEIGKLKEILRKRQQPKKKKVHPRIQPCRPYEEWIRIVSSYRHTCSFV